MSRSTKPSDKVVVAIKDKSRQRDKSKQRDVALKDVVPLQSEEPTYIFPPSDELDPFSSLSSDIGNFEEHLLKFYLKEYPKLTYGLAPDLKPHPSTTNFELASRVPAALQVVLSRAALYQLSLSDGTDAKADHDLQVAVAQHKLEAISIVADDVKSSIASDRGQIADSLAPDKEDMVASIISLGSLMQRTEDKKASETHFAAVRRMLREMGGPSALKSVQLSQVMCHFESIYGTKDISYVFDRAHNLGASHTDYRAFVHDFWTMVVPPLKKHEVLPHGIEAIRGEALKGADVALVVKVYTVVRRTLPELSNTETFDKKVQASLIWQLSCLFTLAVILYDSVVENSAGSKHKQKHARADKRTQDTPDRKLVELFEKIDNKELKERPLNNHAWILQTYDDSASHLTRIWRAASFVWLLKQADTRLQLQVAQWLQDLFMYMKKTTAARVAYDNNLKSEEPAIANSVRKRSSKPDLLQMESRPGPLKFDSFYFSYATV